MKEIEESKGSVKLKYLVTRAIFANDTYDKGTSPYQDFIRLFRLRDSLIHLKPKDEFAATPNNDIVRISTPQVIKDLPPHLLADHGKNTISSWIGMISTQAMAQWACVTASNMISSIVSILPESKFREMVIGPSGGIFTPPK